MKIENCELMNGHPTHIRRFCKTRFLFAQKNGILFVGLLCTVRSHLSPSSLKGAARGSSQNSFEIDLTKSMRALALP